ncbi:class I SAM-dependent methyltransferase [Mycobacterium sp. 21AC1]|uniref:class I SAM-dependent methyltransferase n=1 Tax=[Mycobacterium] appelbergii TaxID=2939269 RepID=UPI0029392514|nr:class I SAM-dependent methyltransferase [Mycobacterium sp. 21AC1]MDV3128737.1 class I SAM-dependent methyltransferase [Mycobacterium sp. 21AC1]
MSDHTPCHTDRRRADSFGEAADAYDRFRPRYPQSLITELVTRVGIRTLDVGAGTGIASVQLAGAGAEVLAVEPDPRMAAVAAGKGVCVEQATFEDWAPDGRQFDLVVFGQSFHWVEPRQALPKVATILSAGGRLALLWNRITPTSPSRAELDEIYAGYLDASQRPTVDAGRNVAVAALIEECGFGIEHRNRIEQLHYSTDDWLDMVFTYSNVLTLTPTARSELRARLEKHIGDGGVDAENSAIALICTPH